MFFCPFGLLALISLHVCIVYKCIDSVPVCIEYVCVAGLRRSPRISFQ